MGGGERRRLYARQFDDAFHLLSDTPTLGNESDFIKQAYRKLPVASHLISYRGVGSSEIEVVRILHKRMDVKIQLGAR